MVKKFNFDDKKIVTGLDLGSNSIKCVMAMMDQDQFEIIGFSQVEHDGFQKQQVVDTKATAKAIHHVCQEVEIISERNITDLWIGLGSPFRLFESNGMAIISGGQVTRKHILQAIDVSRAFLLPDHQEIVHILPSYFRVDKKDPVFNPIGLSGLRLETSVLLVTCDLSSIQDLNRCLKDAERVGRGFAIQPLACGLSVATEDDKNQGVCVIDIGKTSTQVSVFLNGRVIYMTQVNFGGGDLTGELVNQLKISFNLAENLKITYGIPNKEERDKIHHLSSDHSICLREIYNSHYQSLKGAFLNLKQELTSKGLMNQMLNGIILTGGGSQLKNLNLWARDFFEKPVRKGEILGVDSSFSSQLQYSAAVGLLHYSGDDRLDFKQKPMKLGNLNIRNWIKDLIP